MARKVFITDDMGLDEALVDIAAENPTAAMLWPWIVPYFDDWGRADASPRRIKGKVFPLFAHITADAIEQSLNAYDAAGIIRIYEVEGKAYMSVDPEKWFRYQTHIHADKRTNDKSRFPAPPPRGTAAKVTRQDNPAENRGESRRIAENRASPSPSPSPSPTPSLSPSPSPTTTTGAVEVDGDEPTGSLSDTAPSRRRGSDFGVYVENILSEADRNPDRAHWRQALADEEAAKIGRGDIIRNPGAFRKDRLDRWVADPASRPLPPAPVGSTPPRRLTPSEQRHREIAAQMDAKYAPLYAELDRLCPDDETPPLRLAAGGFAA